MEWKRLISAVTLSVLGCAVAVTAQTGTSERKEKTKIEIKDGRDVTLTGCLERSSGMTNYVLTDEVGDLRYAVVTDDDLGRYVNRRVEIKGRAADRGDGKVKIERRTEGTSGRETESKVEAKGDTTVLPYLGLKSIKDVGRSCSR